MERLRAALSPSNAFRLVLVVATLAMLALNFPGQLSWDSVSQLHEGRFGVRETWGPVVYSAILAGFDRLLPGTGLYLIASTLLLVLPLAALTAVRGGVSWAAPVTAAVLLALPTFMSFQGDIWKDVLFANLAIAAFLLLAHAAVGWGARPRPWALLIGVLVMLALAAQVRQNGLIAAVVAAATLGWIARTEGLRKALSWSLGGLVAVVALSQTLALLSMPHGPVRDDGAERGLVILQRYDIIGVLAHAPQLPLDEIRKADPAVEALIRTRGLPLYSAERIDFLGQDPAIGPVLKSLPAGVVGRQWRSLVLHHPRAYLAHRLDVFRWVFLTPDIDSCLPLYVGVDGPAPLMGALGLKEGVSDPAQSLYNYGTYFLDGPAFSHLTYAVAALGVLVLCLMRRDPQDIAIAGLMLAALAFAASFLAISIACDYRYLYFLDLAAVAGLIYLAIDPPLAQLRLRPRMEAEP